MKKLNELLGQGRIWRLIAAVAAVFIVVSSYDAAASCRLSEQCDVSIPNPTDGQALKYSASQAKWIAQTDNSTSLSSMTDVNIPNPTDGQVLKYSTSQGKWLAQSGSSSSLSSMTDVNIASPSTGQVLLYDGSKWANTAYGRRNLLINGDMQVWQRGTSFTADGYTADRWYVDGTANFTVSRQSSALAGYQYSMRVARDSGQTWTTQVKTAQPLETVDSIPYQGQTVTLSFYAKAGANYSPTSAYLVSRISTGTGTDESRANLIAGSWTGQSNSDQNNALTTSFQRFTQTVTLSAGQTQIGVQFMFTPVGTAGANDYLEITGVQLEVGGIPTPFERRTYGEELRLAQRYYEVWGGGAYAEIYVSGYAPAGVFTQAQFIPYKVSKRVPPTFASFGTWTHTLCGNPGLIAGPAGVAGLSLGANTSGAGNWVFYNDAGSGFTVDAEL
jgi:hypothetical protein